MSDLVPQSLAFLQGIPSDAASRLNDQVAMLWSGLRSPHSRRAYRTDWAAFCVFLAAEGADPLHAGASEVTRFLESMTNGKGEPLARATRARRLAVLRGTYAAIFRAGLRRDNPAREMRPPRVDRAPRTPWLTASQLIALLRPLGDTWVAHRNRLVLFMLLGLALRRSSVAGARRGDLVSRSDGRLGIHVLAKGGKEANLLLPAWLAKEVQTWLAFSGVTGPLFPRLRRVGYGDTRPEMDRPIGPGAVRDIVKAAAKRAGIDEKIATPHAIRRSYVTLARERGAELDDLQTALMHASVKTTEGYDRAARSMRSAPGDLFTDIYEAATLTTDEKEQTG